MAIEFENSPEYDLHSSVHAAPIINQYKTEKQILESDLSTVYMVRNRFTNELFTLKAIRKTEGISFDFQKIIKLKHENIVTMSAHYETEKFHYIIKPYIEGIDLQKHVHTYGPLSTDQTNALIKQLISAIKYLHDRKEPLIFRDLKPSNIIVEPPTGDDAFKVTLVDIETMRQKNASKRSDTYYVMSHGYTSPEQYGYRQTDVRSDIYSLGATLFFAVTGEEPGGLRDIAKICHEKCPVIDKRLALAIERCMAFDPDNRFADIFAFERALKRTDYMPLIRKNSIALAAVLFLTIGISFAFNFESLREFSWFATMQQGTTLSDSQSADGSGIVGESLHSSLGTTQQSVTENTPIVFELPTPLEMISSNVLGGETDLNVEEPLDEEPFGEESTSGDVVVNANDEDATAEITISIQSTTQAMTQTTTEAKTVQTTEAYAMPLIESTTESVKSSDIAYHNGERVVTSKNGIIITIIKDTWYTVWADRSQLTEGQKNFEYMSVFSYGDIHGDPDFTLWSNDAVEKGHGFHIYYDDIGYGSINTMQHYVVFLFDSNKNLVGSIDFKNIR